MKERRPRDPTEAGFLEFAEERESDFVILYLQSRPVHSSRYDRMTGNTLRNPDAEAGKRLNLLMVLRLHCS